MTIKAPMMPSRLPHRSGSAARLRAHVYSHTRAFDGREEGKKAYVKSRFSGANFPLYSGEVGSPRSDESGRVWNFSGACSAAPSPSPLSRSGARAR